MALKWDPELLASYPGVAKPLTLPTPSSKTPEPVAFRQFNNEAVRHASASIPYPSNVTESKHTTISIDGTEITVTRFATSAQRQADSASPQPAIVYAFGGGLIAGNVETRSPKIAADVVSWDVQVFAVHYRLAPEHPAPAAVEDCYATIKWLSENGAELGVDPAHISVMGESAGGCVAAGAALLARDRRLSPPLAKQFLFCPMLDDRTSAKFKPENPLIPFLFWTSKINRFCWEAYLGADKAGDPDSDVSPYSAPGRARDVAGLPSTYIDIGGLDLFCHESIEYAAKLCAAGVEVEIHVHPGLPHGFDVYPDVASINAAKENRRKAIQHQ